MRQTWGRLLFLHWPVAPEGLRPLLPPGLALDTFDGQAWLGVVPFTMWGIQPTFGPPLPGLRAFHELNVRTYVHRDGLPGVWFFSLDAASPLAVWAARTFYHLPYFRAAMDLAADGGVVRYSSRRRHRGAPAAHFRCAWRVGEPLPATEPGSLPFFLTERYCLYAARGRRLWRGRILHPPWPLRRAEILDLDSTMVESHGLPSPEGEPLVHGADEIRVEIWGLEDAAAPGAC